MQHDRWREEGREARERAEHARHEKRARREQDRRQLHEDIVQLQQKDTCTSMRFQLLLESFAVAARSARDACLAEYQDAEESDCSAPLHAEESVHLHIMVLVCLLLVYAAGLCIGWCGSSVLTVTTSASLGLGLTQWTSRLACKRWWCVGHTRDTICVLLTKAASLPEAAFPFTV